MDNLLLQAGTNLLKSVTTPPSLAVIPANAGIQIPQRFLDPGFRRGDNGWEYGYMQVGTSNLAHHRTGGDALSCKPGPAAWKNLIYSMPP